MKTIILLLAFTTQLFAQLPTKLEALKSKRDAAIENINQIYKQELQKLMADPQVKADPVEMAKILSELGDMDVSKIDTVDASDISKFFVGKSWFSTAGVEYHFNKDQTGFRKSVNVEIPMFWRLLPNGLVEITSRMSINGQNKLWFFKFSDKKTALFGENEKEIINPLTSEK